MNEKRRERTKELYIDITCDMIRQSGINAVTIRSISEKAGYNSATLYSYFDNLSDLIFNAHMKFENQLLEIFKAEIKKENVTSVYDIWPRMYSVMAEFYIANPNMFDCVLANDYACGDNFDVKSQRDKSSDFNLYVNEKLEQIAQQTGKDITLINHINSVCLAQVTGIVLLFVKRRQTLSKSFGSDIHNDIKKIISCFMEDNKDEKNDF